MDIGLIVSHREGLSNSILEYMYAEATSYCYRFASQPRRFGGSDGDVFCRPAEVDELARRLRSVLLDSELRAGLGAHNRARIESEFSIEKMCEQTMRIVNQRV